MNDLSLRIKELRKNRGWTQAKLWERLTENKQIYFTLKYL